MKTKVPKLYFDWTNPYTGECPASYSIQVDNLNSKYCGDLKSRRVISLLKNHGSQVVGFPKRLMVEVYDDCCLAVLTRMHTMEEDEHVIFTIRQGDFDESMTQKIIATVMGRCMAATFQVMDCEECADCDDCEEKDECKKKHCEAREKIKTIIDLYEAEGDWISELSDESEMVKVTTILLDLRRDFWHSIPKSLRDSRPDFIELLRTA